MPVWREGCKYCRIEWSYENSYNGERNLLGERSVYGGQEGQMGRKDGIIDLISSRAD